MPTFHHWGTPSESHLLDISINYSTATLVVPTHLSQTLSWHVPCETPPEVNATSHCLQWGYAMCWVQISTHFLFVVTVLVVSASHNALSQEFSKWPQGVKCLTLFESQIRIVVDIQHGKSVRAPVRLDVTQILLPSNILTIIFQSLKWVLLPLA